MGVTLLRQYLKTIKTQKFSCDIGWHFYTKFGEWYLQKKYGDRLTLFIGDSKKLFQS